MKLIIISQRVDINDDNLSFFHRILEKFSQHLEKIFSVCLWEGEHHLAENVEVFSLGKDKGYSKIRQFFRLQKFLLKHLKEVDGVYVHMCPIYAIASFPLAKIFKKKLILWYAHGSVNIKLKLAEKLVDVIVTSSLEGCRLKSKKIKVIGQGIDVDLFKPVENNKQDKEEFKILYASRLTPVKDHKTLLEAVNILINEKGLKNIKVKILGTPLLDDQKKYLDDLKKISDYLKINNYVEFLSGAPYLKMPKYYQWADLFVNTSYTGSMDKVVLEAMATGCLVLNCNDAYRGVLEEKYLFKKNDSNDLSDKIIKLINAKPDPNLRKIVVQNHNLDILNKKIISLFYENN